MLLYRGKSVDLGTQGDLIALDVALEKSLVCLRRIALDITFVPVKVIFSLFPF